MNGKGLVMYVYANSVLDGFGDEGCGVWCFSGGTKTTQRGRRELIVEGVTKVVPIDSTEVVGG